MGGDESGTLSLQDIRAMRLSTDPRSGRPRFHVNGEGGSDLSRDVLRWYQERYGENKNFAGRDELLGAPRPEWVRRLSVSRTLPPGIRQGNPDFKKPVGRRAEESKSRVPRSNRSPHTVPVLRQSHPHDVRGVRAHVSVYGGA